MSWELIVNLLSIVIIDLAQSGDNAIVIGMAVVLFMVFLALQVYRIYGTLDAKKIAEERKRREE